MPAFSRSSSNLRAIGIGVGTCAVLLLIVVLMTGGFVIDVGPFRVSVRRWRGPLVIALAAWTSMAVLGRRAGLAAGMASIAVWLDRHAVALAVVLGGVAAGVGIAFGTYSASGADAAGYLSQAELLGSARVVIDEPLARRVRWPDATWAFSPLGYRPGLSPGALVPTYPSGLPLAMAAARGAGEWGPFTVVPLFGALAVFCTYALGAGLHSRTAGFVAAVLLTTSPIFLFQLVQPMSDVPATAWWALALLLALSPRRAVVLAAGAAAGFAVLTRPNLFPIAFVIAAVAVARSRVLRSHPHALRAPSSGAMCRLRAFAAGMTPAFATLMILNGRIYGSAFASGYGSFSDLFNFANVWPNTRDYAWRLLQGEAPALCLAAASIAALQVVHRRAGQDTRQNLAGPVGVAAAVALAVLVCYLPYATFTEWSYLRFLLSAFPVGFVVVGALLTSASTRLPEPVRGLTLLVVLTVAASANVTIATSQQAFNLRRYEARYRDVGRYLDAALPPSAVVFTVQESASVLHYTHRPVVRWDLLRVDLETAVSTLTTLGRTPVLLVEDWEHADLRARFPASPIARLDWRPRADVGSDTRVRLFDPKDRGEPPGRVTTDRFR